MRKEKRTIVISIEGLDGSGKTQFASRVKQYLEERSFIVGLFQEPFGLESKKPLKRAMKRLGKTFYNPISEAMLFILSRLETISTIEGGKKDYDVVIFDRYIDSTIAYQCGGRFCSEQQIERIAAAAGLTRKWYPDITFLLECSIDECKQRIENRSKEEVGESIQHWDMLSIEPKIRSRIEEKYREIASKNAERFIVIDTEDLDAFSNSFMKEESSWSMRFLELFKEKCKEKRIDKFN